MFSFVGFSCSGFSLSWSSCCWKETSILNWTIVSWSTHETSVFFEIFLDFRYWRFSFLYFEKDFKWSHWKDKCNDVPELAKRHRDSVNFFPFTFHTWCCISWRLRSSSLSSIHRCLFNQSSCCLNPHTMERTIHQLSHINNLQERHKTQTGKQHMINNVHFRLLDIFIFAL